MNKADLKFNVFYRGFSSRYCSIWQKDEIFEHEFIRLNDDRIYSRYKGVRLMHLYCVTTGKGEDNFFEKMQNIEEVNSAND